MNTMRDTDANTFLLFKPNLFSAAIAINDVSKQGSIRTRRTELWLIRPFPVTRAVHSNPMTDFALADRLSSCLLLFEGVAWYFALYCAPNIALYSCTFVSRYVIDNFGILSTALRSSFTLNGKLSEFITWKHRMFPFAIYVTTFNWR